MRTLLVANAAVAALAVWVTVDPPTAGFDGRTALALAIGAAAWIYLATTATPRTNESTNDAR